MLYEVITDAAPRLPRGGGAPGAARPLHRPTARAALQGGRRAAFDGIGGRL